MIPIETITTDLSDWAVAVAERAKTTGWRYGHLAVRRNEGDVRIIDALFVNAPQGSVMVISAPIPAGTTEFPSVTERIPAAHWAERMIGDFWGLRAAGHPRWKSLILNEAWPKTEFPFAMPSDGPLVPRETHTMAVSGEGVHEIPVGPIHAGIIEPGHFRFSCLGEVIANLEIRLGYQHRGVELRLARSPLSQIRHIAERVSSDSTVANALAHSQATENLIGIEVPYRSQALRTIALEIERLANHLGDLGALAGDIGFAVGAATFGRLRGFALGLGQTLSGSRFQQGFICPGGVAWDVASAQLRQLESDVRSLESSSEAAIKLFFENSGVLERMEDVGVLAPSLAAEFGLVGPAARASGIRYDARCHFAHGCFPNQPLEVALETSGDVFARAKVRRKEIETSLSILRAVLSNIADGPVLAQTTSSLPPGKSAVGIVESWRGELIHWMTTNSDGSISRYVVRDPSLQNWTGLAIAVRKNLVADFPLINKSFNLSYSGNDL